MDQITHRGRVATIGSTLLLQNEWDIRIEKLKAAKAAVPAAKLTDADSKALSEQFAATVLKHLVLDPKLVEKYKSTHAKSSAVPGIKWADTPPGDDEIWRELFSWIVSFHEDWAEGKLYGMLMNRPLWSGLRARNKSAIERHDLPEFVKFSSEDKRSRTVNFWIGLSSVGMFVRDKHALYRDLLAIEAQMFTTPLGGGRSISPLVEGGDVYLQVAEHLKDKIREPLIVELGDDRNEIMDGEIRPYDMAGCEAITGDTLGPGFYPVLTSAGGFAQLGSGVYCTSILDMYTTRAFRRALGFGVQQSDSLEWQQADYKVQFLLGMRYKEDPFRPRLQGMKLTGDSADKAVSLQPGRSIELRGSHGSEVVERWILAYKGETPSGGTLLDGLIRYKEEKGYFDPSRFVETAVGL